MTPNARAITLDRQPIVNANRDLVGFDIRFRAGPATGGEAGQDAAPLAATTQLVADVFSEIGLAQVIGPGLGFLQVEPDFLMSELVEALPPERLVLELSETAVQDELTLARAATLRERGYRIALSGFVGNFADFDTLLPGVDILKVDFARLDPLLVPEIVQMGDRGGLTVVAENIDQPAQFGQARELGIAWFQGFHFAVPEVIRAQRARPARLALLQLLSRVLHDCGTHEIEDGFKHHPALAVNLLRLVNSAAFGRREPVTSLRHAVVMLGRRQLQLWLQLLLFTADRDNGALASPLLQLAATRGKLMEQLADRPGSGGVLADLAFMTGLLSLADTLFATPMAEVLPGLGVPAPVAAALLDGQGELGALLALTVELERGEEAGLARALRAAPGDINRGDLLALQLAACRWAGEIATAP